MNQKALDQKANRIIVVGTRVFRAAMNQKLVCKRIRKETGFDVEVLSDQEEALLGTSFRSIRAESSGAESAGSASSVGESGGIASAAVESGGPYPGFRLGVGT
ncbi:hypothetical protein MUP95_10640, partial [bacterium]|nr:hypothetical protein [bacterium]